VSALVSGITVRSDLMFHVEVVTRVEVAAELVDRFPATHVIYGTTCDATELM
jgi:hypothetical protein